MRRLAFALIALALAAGCSVSPESRLVGTWQGRPEPLEGGSVLERFDFTLTARFKPDHTVELVLRRSKGDETKSGRWQIVDAAGDRITLEVTLIQPGHPKPANPGTPTPPSKGDTPGPTRHFSIEFTADSPDGFHLREVGSKPQFGVLLFERASS